MNSSRRVPKLLLCTGMSDSVCRVNGPKPRDEEEYTTQIHTDVHTDGKGRVILHTHTGERDEGSREGKDPRET